MRFVFGYFFDGDGADARSLVDIDELLGRWMGARDEYVAEQHGEGFSGETHVRRSVGHPD